MRTVWQLSIIMLLFVGCGQKKEAVQTAVPESPSWVQNRPISSTYYVGIGVAPKTSEVNFQATAKKNALSDLASEIKVNVNTNSLLYTLEQNSSFEQEFRESIRTTSNLDLDQFEIVDTWQDVNSYWVYYRLDKTAYAEAQRKKKETAQALALDFLAKAQTEKDKGHFTTAADYYLRGLQAIEGFWNEENKVTFGDQTILLDNTLFTGLKSLLTDLNISVENEVALTFANRYGATAKVLVRNSENFPQENVPLKYEYFGMYGRSRSTLNTNTDGRLEIPIVNSDKTREGNALTISVDAGKIFEPFQSDSFMRKLTESMQGASIQTPIKYIPPVVFLESDEKNMGKAMSGKPLEAAISTSLGRHGIRLATNRNSADLIIKLNSDTKKLGQSQGFTTAQLNFNVSVTDQKTGESRYQISRSDVKGVDLTFEKAGLKAYQNLTGNIESELMRPIVNDLF